MIEQFHRPRSVREALALRRRLRAKAAFLAGGTWANNLEGPPAPPHAISLEGLGLDRVQVRAGALAIGACATLQQLADDRRVPAPLRAAIAQVVSRNIRNAATIGGHVAADLPQSDVVPMLVALGASFEVAGVGRAKLVPAAEYAAKPVPGLVVSIRVPKLAAGRTAACRNVRESAHARSSLSVALAVTVKRGTLSDAVIACSGLARRVVRLAAVERALEGAPVPADDALSALVERTVKPAPGGIGSVALRRAQAGALVVLALREALAAKGGRS